MESHIFSYKHLKTHIKNHTTYVSLEKHLILIIFIQSNLTTHYANDLEFLK